MTEYEWEYEEWTKITNSKQQVLLAKQHSKKIDESKPPSKLTLKTKWYHSCDCCDDSQSYKQLKKHVNNKYFEERLEFEP